MLNKTNPFKFIIFVGLFLMFIPALSSQQKHKFDQINLPGEFQNIKANCVLEDSKGFIWIGFDQGLVFFDGYSGKSVIPNTNEDQDISFASSPIVSLKEDSKGHIWVGSAIGVFKYDPVLQTSEQLNDPLLVGKTCRSLDLTSKEELLIGTQSGLFIYNLEGAFLERYSHQQGSTSGLSHNIVRCTYEDQTGDIWIGTYDKLNLLQRENNLITQFNLQKKDSIFHDNNLVLSIKPMSADNDSILLVGTETGLCLFNTKTHTFSQYRHQKNKNSISNSIVKTICKVDDQLWLGTDLGLNQLDLKEQLFGNYFTDVNNSFSISNNVVNDIFLDSHRNLWIATDAGVNTLFINSNTILVNQFGPNAPFLNSGVTINNKSDKHDELWLATNYGAFWYQQQNNTVKNFLPPDILHNKVEDILSDDDGMVWIGTTGGLNRYDPKRNKFSSFVAQSDQPNVLTTNYITCLAQDSKGVLWMGTQNKGLFKMVKNKGKYEFINYEHLASDENSISSNIIFDVAFDENDNAWIATEEGINCFYVSKGVIERFTDTNKYGKSPNQGVWNLQISKNDLWISSQLGLYKWNFKSEKFQNYIYLPEEINANVAIDSSLFYVSKNRLYYYNESENKTLRIPNNEIGLSIINDVQLLDNNKLILFGKEGFSIFDPKELTIDDRIPNIKLTKLSINNTEITPKKEYNSRFIIDRNIDELNALKLNYDENTFRVDFTSFPFNDAKTIDYEYILEGYDNNWQTTTDQQNYISFTQVRPGDYKLKIRSSNKYGLFDDNFRMLNIKIKPPVYLSNTALVLYLILFILTILLYRKALIKREREKNELIFEKLNSKRSEELIELKTRFFTNITHELKTPLTLISSPVDELMNKPLDPSTLKSLSLVKRNTDRLRKLVSQILDIKKIEAGGEKLMIQQYDIVKFCEQILNQFNEESLKRNIFLQFSSNKSSLFIWFDLEKMEKILFNLLSNAFKFTPDGGTIKLIVSTKHSDPEKNDFLSISVSDTGNGFSDEDKAALFNRFGNLTSTNYSNQKGTGIGMSIIDEYVSLHSGDIEVESLLNVGSTFIISIPKKKSLLHNYQIHADATFIEEKPEEQKNISQPVENKVVIPKSKKGQVKLLIVEDDADIREFLKIELKSKYEILEAEDGEEGKKVAFKELPDIIISDLMMPNMDGLELCEILKDDIRTCHIPFILLTAKSEVQSKIQSMELGADDYLEKPFNMEHVAARIQNLLNQRKLLHQIIRQQIKLEPSKVTVTSLDENFLDLVLAQIENEMDNSELNVKLLSDKMKMSTTNLYRKIKSLTGETATEFIRNIRLKKASELLKNEQLNISEVMYMVGFTHHSYFTKCFKDLHGVSPKEFRK